MAVVSLTDPVPVTPIDSDWGLDVNDAVEYLDQWRDDVHNYRCHAYRTSATTMSGSGIGTWTVIDLSGGELYDTKAMHDTASAPWKVTLNKAGMFRITATLLFETNSTGQRLLGLYKDSTGTLSGGNPTGTRLKQVNVGAAHLGWTTLETCTTVESDGTTTVAMFGLQNSGSSLYYGISGDPWATYLIAEYLSPVP